VDSIVRHSFPDHDMTNQPIEQAGKVDLVIGLVPPSSDSEDMLRKALLSIRETSLPYRMTVVHPPLTNAADDFATADPRWQFVSDARLSQDRSALAKSFGQSFRVIFDLAGTLQAGACAIISSDLSAVTTDWVDLLAKPVLDANFDLVAPCYAAGPFEGFMNRSIVSPMVRALYGKRVHNPMGPDFGLSSRMLARMASSSKPRLHPLVSLVAEAIAAEMKICQVHLGNRIYPTTDWADPTPILSQLLSALFLDVERFAPWWQRSRVSQPIPEFGTAGPPGASPDAVDTEMLIRGFQRGARTLIQSWGMILPPSTLVDLRRLAAAPATAKFRIADGTWARVIYDFALAHRLRPKDREEMLRAFTPIYMGWVASYALEIASAAPNAVDHRMEELCCAFETAKPYFVSRWRWPDRFNP
jgi:glucosylglycerate synthase